MTAAKKKPQPRRVAVYTRQSVADDKDFGSIQAQREAIEAYVTSQRGEGWQALDTRYDDRTAGGPLHFYLLKLADCDGVTGP